MFQSLKILIVISILFISSAFSVNAQQDNNVLKGYYEYNSKNTLNNLKYTQKNNRNKSLLGFSILSNHNRFKSSLSLNMVDMDNYIFDGSFFEYKFKNSSAGIGKIDRNWSFSPNTSLILSKNARPSTSIFYKIKSDENNDKSILLTVSPWSIEFFNGLINTSKNKKDSMLLGGRVTISPFKNLNIEFVKTSQWGGYGHENSLSGLFPALFSDTNLGENAHINQLAGFGLSYIMPYRNSSLRVYGQAVGEDESNYLPSCYMKLIGVELSKNIFEKANTFGIEFIDTKISKTKSGFCGPNTAYNNSEYKYTNYDTVMGAPIDTEGTSLNLWAQTDLTEKIKLNYSLKKISINKDNWSMHRLSNSHEAGWNASSDISLKKNNLTIRGSINYQSFDLSKSEIDKGLSFNLSTSIAF